MLTLVTTTRDRPECFSLLERWIVRQTVQPDQWIVVNDGTVPYQYSLGQTVLQRHPGGDSLPSICENWLSGLPLIHGDKVLVAEDDDWYHGDFIQTMSEMLDVVDLVGVRGNLYYKLPPLKFFQMHNTSHASLASTGFRSSMLPQIERCCRVFKSVYIDSYLWAEATSEGSGVKCALLPNRAEDQRALQVGFKQMPGAKGLGLGHTDDGSTDPGMAVLRGWIGAADTVTYSNFRKIYCNSGSDTTSARQPLPLPAQV
ncbi:glycosyltransferase family A protein [Zavarzinella formosa]|uniref:glycosyltransferase family A protein n=1 Tax=Zavarzinella formosa TaxID=360055 RepID=UPI0002FBB4B9|nr:glycosyltransferase family A protein [Zavarzinella formosa]